jgi:hypothetical protein
MFLPTNPNNLPPFEWAYQHVGLISWPAICYALWKVTRYIDGVTATATKTINQIDTLATNHAPHMEESLKTQDGLLHSMDASLKEIAQNTGRRRNTDFDGNRN